MKAPFPWFGGKSRVAHIVWDRFGDVRNYVEPFAGSLAVLLGRPTVPKVETVNDLDCLIANFWRAVTGDPEGTAHYADWPVNEADLHARHLWLVREIDRVIEIDGAERQSFRERMKTDPDYFDAKIAGWWVWGISQWIGSGWCTTPGSGVHSKRPRLGGDRGRGALSAEVPNQLPILSFAGGGIHASGLITGVHGERVVEKMPQIDGREWGMRSEIGMGHKGGLYGWFAALSDRLRRVRVCCGDWQRILGRAPTTCIGTTGVFLDPPYAVEDRRDVYGEESRDVAHAVREWAIANGNNPELRIALCGYTGEHELPRSWTEVAWKANGGFGNRGKETRGMANAHRERIWFSPCCLRPHEAMFEGDGLSIE